MAYCTIYDLGNYLDGDTIVRLSDDNADGTADADVIDTAIDNADSEIDGYCSAHYATPFSSAPLIVRRMSAILAIYHLYLRRPEAEMPEKWEIEVKDIRRMLDRIARGLIQLGTAAAGAECGDMAEASRTIDEATFGEDALGGF